MILSRLNEARSRSFIPATGMIRLEWNPQLATQVHNVLTDAPCLVGDYRRSNFTSFIDHKTPSASPNFTDLDESITFINEAMRIWTVEEMIDIVEPASRNIDAGSRIGVNVFSNYSQLVWASSSSVGCAYAHCDDRFRNLVCHFQSPEKSPSGNVPGEGWFVYGMRATQCPQHTKPETTGLCRSTLERLNKPPPGKVEIEENPNGRIIQTSEIEQKIDKEVHEHLVKLESSLVEKLSSWSLGRLICGLVGAAVILVSILTLAGFIWKIRQGQEQKRLARNSIWKSLEEQGGDGKVETGSPVIAPTVTPIKKLQALFGFGPKDSAAAAAPSSLPVKLKAPKSPLDEDETENEKAAKKVRRKKYAAQEKKKRKSEKMRLERSKSRRHMEEEEEEECVPKCTKSARKLRRQGAKANLFDFESSTRRALKHSKSEKKNRDRRKPDNSTSKDSERSLKEKRTKLKKRLDPLRSNLAR